MKFYQLFNYIKFKDMNLKNIFCLSFIMILMFSCIDDEGNYDYNYLDEVSVTNIDWDLDYGYEFGESIIFDPGVVTDMDDSELTYTWYMDRYMQKDTIGTEKILNRLADFAGGYFYLSVRHIESGVLWEFPGYFAISLPYDSGWAILSNTSGGAKFNFLSGINTTPDGINYEYYPSVYRNENGEQLPSSGKQLIYARNDNSWIIQFENEGIVLDNETMIKTKDLSEYISSTEYLKGTFTPEFVGFSSAQANYSLRLLSSGGDLFAATNLNYGESFGFAAPIEGDHYIGKYVASIYSKHHVVFDEANKRYLWVNLGSGRLISIVPTLKPGDDFEGDIGDLKMECKWMEKVGWDKVYTVLKDESGDFHLHGLKGNNYVMEFPTDELIETGKANDNSLFTSGDNNVYFTTDNALHFYNTGTKTFTYNWMEFDDDILAVKLAENKDELAVAIKDGDNSKLLLIDYYEINPDDMIFETISVEGHIESLVRTDW